MEVMEASNILRNSLTEAVSYWDQVPKMNALEKGTRGFNAKAASDEKLKVNRQVCLDYKLWTALSVVEDEMLARGLISQKTVQSAPAQQVQTQPQAQPTPAVQPTTAQLAETRADRFVKEFNETGAKNWVIPSGEDVWQLVVDAHKKGDIHKITDVKVGDITIYYIIKRFIIAALLGYTDIQAALKQILIDNGFNNEIIKMVLAHVLANKNKFEHLYKKYKEAKVENLTEDIFDDDGTIDAVPFIPQEDDFKKVCDSMRAYTEDEEFCSFKLNPNKIPGILRSASNGNPSRLIRRFIASSLLQWELLSNNLKEEIKKMGIDQDQMSKIMQGVLKEKQYFVPVFLKYKPIFEAAKKKTESLTESPDTDVDKVLLAAVNNWGLIENLNENTEIEEDVEKHDKLNPKLFENNHLKPEVRERLLGIVDEFAKNFTDPVIPFKVQDIVLTGSNASYNYTKDSDIDLHIIADTTGLDDPNKLYPIIYDAYKSIFNNKMDINIYEIPVEIYVETEDTTRVSNGVYSVKNDAWVQEPVETIIPEIDWNEFMKAYQPWEDEYKKIVKEAEGEKSIDETPIDDFVDRLYVLRQQGLQNGGEYSFENLIFKELRNRGHLERLKDLKNRIIANRLSLKSLDEAYLDDDHKFFDYKTAEIADDEYVDVKKGSNFSAQDLLDGSNDKAYEKLDSKIEQITPKQYFAICSRIQHQPVDDLLNYVKDDKDKLEHLVQVIKVYNKKFPIPYANFVPGTEPEGQEGKHRMYVLGELFGWDTPFPVQIIRAK